MTHKGARHGRLRQDIGSKGKALEHSETVKVLALQEGAISVSKQP